MAKSLISGLYGTEFYALLEKGLLKKGYANLEDFFAEAPNYWFDEEKWKSVYTLAPFENPTRVFEQRIGGVSVPIMATYLSDEAEGPLLATQGASKETGEIPRMGRGSAFDVDAYEKMQQLSRQNVDVTDKFYDQFVKDTLSLVQTVHSQRTFTGLQVESKGSFATTKETSGGIIGFTIDLHPVATNRKACGGYQMTGSTNGKKYAWSSDSASPIGDLQDMFFYGWQHRLVSSRPSENVFRMSKSNYEVLKAHADTKVRVAFWKYGPVDSTFLAPYKVTDGDLKDYLASLSLPEIDVEDYFGFGSVLNAKTKKIETRDTEAFDANTVVLRAKGNFGEIQWKRASNLLSAADSQVLYSEGGAMAIARDNGKKGLVFQIESICVPVPNNIQRVLYLSTNEAAS